MAAIDMPASPTVNQSFEAQNGVTYIWDGEKWNLNTAQGGGGGFLTFVPPLAESQNKVSFVWSTMSH